MTQLPGTTPSTSDEPQPSSRQENREKSKISRIAQTIFSRIDRFSVKIGSHALRHVRRVSKRAGKYLKSLGLALKKVPAFLLQQLVRLALAVRGRILRPIGKAFAVVFGGLGHLAVTLFSKPKDLREEARQYRKKAGPQFSKILNHLLPVAAIGAAALVISTVMNLNFVLRVEYNDEVVGYIDSETTFDQAKKAVNERIALKEDSDDEFIKGATYTLAIVPKEEVITSDTLANRLIQASGEDIVEAAGIYINGEFFSAVSSSEGIEEVLDNMLKPYRDKYPDAKSIGFNKSIEIKIGLYPEETVVEDEEIVALFNSEEQGERLYVAKSGDTPISIASENDVSLGTLVALNPTITDQLFSGTTVVIQESVPFLQGRVEREIVYKEEIDPGDDEEIQSDQYDKGTRTVLSEGESGEQEVTAELVIVGEKEVSRTVLSAKVIREPVPKKVAVGTKVTYSSGGYGSSSSYTPGAGDATGTGSLLWPVAGGYVSAGLGAYYGHTGMDIAAPAGTAIYAADSGVVTKAGWDSTGYGYCVWISHGNGMVTLYAHCSELLVSAGQSVSRGQVIARVGRTGRATGNHCHFEVRVNGSIRNPANYV